MATCQEEIAQWRAQRQQQQIADRCNQIRQEHAQVVRERDEAIANNDLETAEYRDMDCQQLEKEWAEYNPPQQQRNPQWENWLRRNSTFIEREGQRGVQAITEALRYMQRPRNPASADPRYTGMGLTPQQVFSPQGFDKLESLLEIHGQQFYGVKFDKNEQPLTADEAAKMSGQTPENYNRASQRMGSDQRFSWQQKRG